jgi:hypothetical protein
MKHLLLILSSFFLLSSFVTSCDKKEETLYRWETSSGFEWKRFGDKQTQPRYEGEVGVLSGIVGRFVRSGYGVMIYPIPNQWISISSSNTEYQFDLNKYVGTWDFDIELNGSGYSKSNPRTSYVKYVNGKCLYGLESSMKPCNGEYYNNRGNILGKIVNGTYYDKDGQLLWKIVKGKIKLVKP